MTDLVISLMQRRGGTLLQQSVADATHHRTTVGHERKRVSLGEMLTDKLSEALYKAQLQGCTGDRGERNPERTDCGFDVNVFEKVSGIS